jgi:pyruvate/2-oxoglutarate dehydrogenase complex dihydrolipoamide acyltransferase (E2) component
MTRLRTRIAERLKQAQNTAAMLTTFNEVDMTAAMALRSKYNEQFEKRQRRRHVRNADHSVEILQDCVLRLRPS